MDTRRDFIKKAALLSGATGIFSALPASIQKALAIDPKVGSTYLDAEHVVFLMQENRSFDHCYGALRGVRGFNDPRAITLPNKNLVWLQSNEQGETFVPFRMDFKESKSTWMSSLPHSWENQVDARNEGKYDKWLVAKRSGNRDYAKIPLTLGHYTREDIPFYYAFADAFTVCDQNFCSSLTGTTPNRLYFWSGTIRAEKSGNVKANVWNSDVDYGSEASWTTFPERLEDNNISWRIYQNEISLDTGLEGEEDSWLANFTDNPIEWFTQYRVGFHPTHYTYLQKRGEQLPAEIAALEKSIPAMEEGSKAKAEAVKQLEQKKKSLLVVKDRLKRFSPEEFAKLPQRERNLCEKAFTTNKNDPDYRKLTTLSYKDGYMDRELQVPKGDVLHQFRHDVNNGKLPTVSWLVAPCNFSDHPGAPWYGAWYVSEVLDILTKNPEVWKKTIFILAYDENDGDFDHVPPFVAPHPQRTDTGKVSAGIDTAAEYVMKKDGPRESPIGLGYRVPLVVASPWSRGGWVNSEVFDHTSSLQFLEGFLNKKFGKKIEESNITDWRRTVCGDLTSIFRPYNGEKMEVPPFPDKEVFYQTVHKAKFKDVPSNYKILNAEEIAQINRNPHASPLMSKQEKGIRSSCALPYQLYVDGKLSADKQHFEMKFEARDEVFGKRTMGSPFNVYAPGNFMVQHPGKEAAYEAARAWAYAVKAGDALADTWKVSDFEDGNYHLRAYGPNGFFREFKGNSQDPAVDISFEYSRHKLHKNTLTGNVEIRLTNLDSKQKVTVEIKDNAYKKGTVTKVLNVAKSAGSQASIMLELGNSYGWYDCSVRIAGNKDFEKRYAGRVETGKASFSDPAMGNI
ncbi:phosphocholine-specific phospholipase C [Chitinophaga defluvii]|uniref:phospholipase C n=1 Tax=Chitinophaga defluvii TaxID=3163343 RepID=A0ABV2T5Z9_9BACT